MANYQIGDMFVLAKYTAPDKYKITGFDPFVHKFIMKNLVTGTIFNCTEGEINTQFVKIASAAAMSPPVSSSLANAGAAAGNTVGDMIFSQQNVVTTHKIMPENGAPKKCECGCAAVGISKHSNYCPLFKQENS